MEIFKKSEVAAHTQGKVLPEDYYNYVNWCVMDDDGIPQGFRTRKDAQAWIDNGGCDA